MAVSAIGEGARRPSVAAFNGALYLAYERPSQMPGVYSEVVVVRRDGNGALSVEAIFPTAQTDAETRLDPILHAAAGRLWVDWKNAAGQMNYAHWQPGGWTSPVTRACPDGSWIGAEMVRQLIRWSVLAP